MLLARVRIGRGDKPAALAGLSKALLAQPRSLPLRTTRARLLVDMSDHEGALRDFRRLREQEPANPEYLYAVGMLAMHGEHWGEAREVWQQLRSQGGDHLAEASYFLAQVEEMAGKPELAAGSMPAWAAVPCGRMRGCAWRSWRPSRAGWPRRDSGCSSCGSRCRTGGGCLHDRGPAAAQGG